MERLLKPKSLFIKNKPIKLASSGELINEQEFSKRIDQVKWILNSVINGSKAELFGSKKYPGWCNMKEKVVGYKLALCTLDDLYRQMKNNSVVSKIRKDLKNTNKELN